MAPWVELTTTAQDWKSADPALLATMLGQWRERDILCRVLNSLVYPFYPQNQDDA